LILVSFFQNDKGSYFKNRYASIVILPGPFQVRDRNLFHKSLIEFMIIFNSTKG